MKKTNKSLILTISMSLQAIAFAQTPTMSLKATAVNGVPVAGGTANRIVADPGDIVEVKVTLRDWSPNKEVLRSYQATIDSSSFSSGDAGRIEPVGYQGGTADNAANVTLGEDDPGFIHKGFHILPVLQANGVDYKWISVIFDIGPGPVSNQDGVEKVCAIVRMEVSETARGSFHLALYEDSQTSLILDSSNKQILPLAFETLIIDVPGIDSWNRIAGSTPPYASIDARATVGADRSRCASITLHSKGDASLLSPGDFTVTDGSQNPPKIESIEVDGSNATLNLDKGIRLGKWTTITHPKSASITRIGHLPGDVDNNASVEPKDLDALVKSLNGDQKLADFQTDLNADGQSNATDLATLIHWLADESNNRVTKLN